MLSKSADPETPDAYSASVPSCSTNDAIPRNPMSRAVNLVGTWFASQAIGMSCGDTNTRAQVLVLGVNCQICCERQIFNCRGALDVGDQRRIDVGACRAIRGSCRDAQERAARSHVELSFEPLHRPRKAVMAVTEAARGHQAEIR